MLNLPVQEKSTDQFETVIQLENVSVRYRAPEERIGTFKEYAIRTLKRQVQFKEFKALDAISLSVRKGEILGVIGRNGAGKSTLLKVISRVLVPKAGRVWIKGRVSPLLELGAGFHPELTGRENIFVNGTLLGHSHAEIEEKLDSILEFSELAEFIDAPLRTYSSGMMARLGFAVATAWIPDILIVDEVLGVGDYAFQQKCQSRMEEFRNSGTTILLVTHDINAVRRLCDRVVWLERGVVNTVGATEAVLETYLYKSMFGNWFSFAASQSPVAVASGLLATPIDIRVDSKKWNSISMPEKSLVVTQAPNTKGLVSVLSSNAATFCAAKHWLYKSSFNQEMGIPQTRFSTRYWFPVYDSETMNSVILVSNPDDVHQADIGLFFSGEKHGEYQVAPGSWTQIEIPNQLKGPVSLESRTGLFYASQRIIYGDSLLNVPGQADHELASEVWFPWYNTQVLRSWIVVANPDFNKFIKINAYLNDELQGEYQIPAGGMITIHYPNTMAGPFRLRSDAGQPIVATQRVMRGNTFAEMPGLSVKCADLDFWFPWYDYHSMISRIFVVNPNMATAEIVVLIGQRKLGHYKVNAGATLPLDCQNISGGPLRIVGQNGVTFFAMQRFGYGNSLTDINGLPAREFSGEYWFSPYTHEAAQTWLAMSAVNSH